MNRPQTTIITITALCLLMIAALTSLPASLKFFATTAQALAPSTDHDPSPPAAIAREAKKIIVAAAPKVDAAEWFLARGEEPEKHGVLIETFDRTRILATLNADTPFNPASVTKLATTLTALKKLGPDYRFQTRIYADGAVDKTGTLQGVLRIVGNDPTFGDVGAGFIAKELRARGIKRVRDGLTVNSAFCFNFGGAEESAARLVKALNLGNARAEVADENATGEPLFVFKSNSLRDVLLYMNAHSNNYVADAIGALVGGPAGIQQFLVDEIGIPADQVAIEAASGLGHNRLTPRGIVTILRALLEETNRHNLQPEDLMPVARADWGTLHHRLEGTGLEYSVVGKTGTLTTIDGGMACLAGFAYTKDAGPILFTILDHGNNVWNNRQMEDQFLSEIVNGTSAPQAVSSPTPRPLLPATGLSIESE